MDRPRRLGFNGKAAIVAAGRRLGKGYSRPVLEIEIPCNSSCYFWSAHAWARPSIWESTDWHTFAGGSALGHSLEDNYHRAPGSIEFRFSAGGACDARTNSTKRASGFGR